MFLIRISKQNTHTVYLSFVALSTQGIYSNCPMFHGLKKYWCWLFNSTETAHSSSSQIIAAMKHVHDIFLVLILAVFCCIQILSHHVFRKKITITFFQWQRNLPYNQVTFFTPWDTSATTAISRRSPSFICFCITCSVKNIKNGKLDDAEIIATFESKS